MSQGKGGNRKVLQKRWPNRIFCIFANSQEWFVERSVYPGFANQVKEVFMFLLDPYLIIL